MTKRRKRVHCFAYTCISDYFLAFAHVYESGRGGQALVAILAVPTKRSPDVLLRF